MTRRLTSTLGMLAIAALLGGCASLSEEECRNADWGRLGHQDGAAGYPESRLAEHAEACAKIGIRPMGDIWRAGWDRGVLLYCVPSVGWRDSNSHFDFLMGSEAGFRSRNFQTWSYASQMEPDCLGQTGGGPLC